MSTKKLKVTTPKGTAVFPRLNSPDTKFDDNGVYKADLRIPLEEAKPLMKIIDKEVKAHTGKAHPKQGRSDDKRALYFFEEDDDGDLITDQVVFKLRIKNVIPNKGPNKGKLWDRRPKIFDAKKNWIKPNNLPKIGGGSILKVNAEVYKYDMPNKGVKLLPLGVQIIDLVEFGATAESMGFDDEDEGFDATNSDYEGGDTFEETPDNTETDASSEEDEDAPGDFY